MMVERLLSIRRVILLVTAFSVLAAVATQAVAQAQAAESVNCNTCHAGGLPLAEKHPKVKGANIAECMTCHVPRPGWPNRSPS
jgi:hypothetical protein